MTQNVSFNSKLPIRRQLEWTVRTYIDHRVYIVLLALNHHVYFCETLFDSFSPAFLTPEYMFFADRNRKSLSQVGA
jgi:hypothetical protein